MNKIEGKDENLVIKEIDIFLIEFGLLKNNEIGFEETNRRKVLRKLNTYFMIF
jgi:hypothetical protein